MHPRWWKTVKWRNICWKAHKDAADFASCVQPSKEVGRLCLASSSQSQEGAKYWQAASWDAY
eukprot:9443847-Prorocentrum_lima.AAC.1